MQARRSLHRSLPQAAVPPYLKMPNTKPGTREDAGTAWRALRRSSGEQPAPRPGRTRHASQSRGFSPAHRTCLPFPPEPTWETPGSSRLRQIDDPAGLRLVEAEFNRTAGVALALHPFAVAVKLLQHRLGEEGGAAHIAGLRRIPEAMAQQAVGEVDDLGAADLGVGVGDRHRDAEGVEILDAVRRVHVPAQHLAGADVEHLGVVVVPVLVG